MSAADIYAQVLRGTARYTLPFIAVHRRLRDDKWYKIQYLGLLYELDKKYDPKHRILPECFRSLVEEWERNGRQLIPEKATPPNQQHPS